MRIAILSDTHSRYQTVEAALALLKDNPVDLLIHCGDIDDAETIWLFPPNTHFVFGNCDHDRASMRQAIHGIGATLHEPFGALELDETTIAFTHGDDARQLRELELSEFDYVFHGHTHQAVDRRAGKTRVINPGALFRARPKSFAILDLATAHLETMLVE